MSQAGANFNYNRAAMYLAEAAVYGDVKASERAGLSLRTLHNYRKRLEDDDTLSELFQHKREALEKEWAADLAPAIRNSIDFLTRAAQEADVKDPDAIHAVAGAFKLLSNIALTRELLDVRIMERRGTADEAGRPDTTADAARYAN